MRVFIAIVLVALLFKSNIQAQTAEQQTLKANMGTIEDLAKVLTNDYTAISKLENALPKATYVVGKLFCVSPYGDAGANAQTKQIETELSSLLTESKWIFGANTYDRPEFGVMGKLQIVAKSKTEIIDYSSSGALFKPQGLIDGLDVQIAVYQNNKNAQSFIFLFPVASICSTVMEVTKK